MNYSVARVHNVFFVWTNKHKKTTTTNNNKKNNNKQKTLIFPRHFLILPMTLNFVFKVTGLFLNFAKLCGSKTSEK